MLEQRLRERLGSERVHPGGVKVSVVHGRAILSGSVPQDDAKEILRIVCSVRGVRAIVDRLELLDRMNDG